ncbi:hypothetical protein SUDANB140_03641 [Streptomyces sp. enrichment culture]
MTEELATTVAGVAPVVLLVAVVEINNSRQRVRQVYEDLMRPSAVARELFRDGGEPTREQVEHAVRQREEADTRVHAGMGLLLYVLSACVVTLLLFLAELRSLFWLAGDPMSNSRGDATFCTLALVTGFAWVCLAPLVPLLVSITRSLVGMVRSHQDERRLRRLAGEYREQGADRQAARDVRRPGRE